MAIRSFLRRLVARHHGGAILLGLLFVTIATGLRATLLLRSAASCDWTFSLAASFAWGLVFDVGTALLALIPVLLLLALLPARAWRLTWVRWSAHACIFSATVLMVFGAVAEWVFWDEFASRFNFIAVDYLVYTTEVLGNIRESYPIGLMVAGILLVAAIIHAGVVALGLMKAWLDAPAPSLKTRWLTTAAGLGAAILFGTFLNLGRLPHFDNNYNRELAQNGLWSFVAAFRNNEIDYSQFYSTLPIDTAFRDIREELGADGSSFVNPAGTRDTLRYIQNAGPELLPNVIQITVESLSDEFLHKSKRGALLTPNLAELSARSLVFENFYATGTRTDRGMEALSLSLPPTPGRSLIKRPQNSGLFTLGSLFQSRGYDTAFIYGGYGYFDNMNAFFGGNGYRVVDRAAVAKKDVTFANAWGACDEDLFAWTLREADQAATGNRPFHFFVMTTSNHRPFTYPEGRIDLPPKVSMRAGAVKYTDYAIGKFIREASAKPWFKNTVFVIVADHCASVAGKAELPVQNYHIPLIIYAPGGQIAPGKITTLTSQIDFAPTLLGLLHWSYATRFYGCDVTREHGDLRALIGNYQKLGLFKSTTLDVLMPPKGHDSYTYDAANQTLTRRTAVAKDRDEAIAYYQTASYLYEHHGYNAIPVAEAAKLVPAIARQPAPAEGTKL
jgi:phosphoglycerol transferase MdoB-like AlkP superfamily enzyme